MSTAYLEEHSLMTTWLSCKEGVRGGRLLSRTGRIGKRFHRVDKACSLWGSRVRANFRYYLRVSVSGWQIG